MKKTGFVSLLLLCFVALCAAEEAVSIKEISLKAGTRRVLTVDGLEYAFRWCPPGEFMMGGETWHEEAKPVHKVKLTKGFWLLETEVTQEMWESVMDTNPSDFKNRQNPVEQVSWNDCQVFCKKLSEKLGQKVQLPTEAQWEYACRAGSTTNFCWGDDEDTLYQYGNYCDKSNTDGYDWQDQARNDGFDKTAPAGSYKPNAWGLYDMHGNVYEWCSDYHDAKYYEKSPTNDPENTTPSPFRVARGGSCYFRAAWCRSVCRSLSEPDYRSHLLGLRVLLVPSAEE